MLQDLKTGFSSCTAWRQGAARQAIRTDLSSSCEFLGVSVILDVWVKLYDVCMIKVLCNYL